MRKLIFILTLFAWINSVNSQILVNGWQHTGGSTITYDTILVNMWDSVSNVGKVNTGGWNNVCLRTNDDATYGGQIYTYHLKYKDGTQSNIQVAWRLSNLTSRAVIGYNDNTQAWANNNATWVNDTCLRHGSYSTTDNTRFMLTGLDDSKTYTFLFFASRNTATSRTQTQTYGATSDNIANTANNYSDIIVLPDLVPSSGQINITNTHTNGFSFVCWYVIIVKTVT